MDHVESYSKRNSKLKYGALRKSFMNKIQNLEPNRNTVTFTLPVGYPLKPNIFSQKCLLILIIIGFHFNRANNYFIDIDKKQKYIRKWAEIRKIYCNCSQCKNHG